MRVARILTVCVALAMFFVGQQLLADGWSLPNLNPFEKTDTKKTTTTKSTKAAKKEPSALDKASAGTKKFFTNVGDTLSFKKKPAAKPTNQYTPWTKGAQAAPKSSAQPEKKSWLSSMFQPKEPAKAKSPSEWIDQPRVGW